MPELPESVFVHALATQMGDVQIGEYASFWPGSSVRGDFSPIRIGIGTSIQDCCVLHSTPSDGIQIGNFVTVGHGAVLHGCTIEDNCVIGINATVLDKSTIGQGSIVAAGAVVKEGTQVPPGSFVAGLPAEIKPGRPGQEDWIKSGALAYIALAQNYLDGRQCMDPETLTRKIGEIEERLGLRCDL